ncbi:hypothetical protein NEOC65_001394 [Neochlamydia sp. AcF65]|nr:hypothetical protein [Neochlamydia sp. AcF65]MBS4171645.1 hypothetical protein [Neochlamydia sp. AcF95]
MEGVLHVFAEKSIKKFSLRIKNRSRSLEAKRFARTKRNNKKALA